jgi:putative hemolysin
MPIRLMKEKKFIDIEALFQNKNPGLKKWIPGFVFRTLKRIIHEDQLNDFMKRHKADNAVQFSKGVIEEVNGSIETFGMEKVPSHGGIILACNHPMGALEAMAMVSELSKVRTDMKFIVNDILLTLENLKEIFAGVNKHGKTAIESMRAVEELFASDKLIMLFPAGMVARKTKGKVRELDWKKTFITRAKKYGKPVMPVYIEGRNSNLFYNLSNIRSRLGIKSNIEMFLLPHEMYRQTGVHIPIVFGDIIEPATFTREKTDAEWAEYVKGKTFELKEKINKGSFGTNNSSGR